MVMPGPDKFVLPNDRARVIVYLEGALASKPHFPFDRRRVSFTLGEGVEANVCGGIETALFHFKCGETSKLTIEPIAFGLNKLFRIPENEKVIYRVHLQSVDRALEVWEMQGPEKLDIAKKFRDKGNEYFKHEQYRVACRFYKRIVEFLMAEASLESESETERKSLISIAYLSQAQTYLKLGENEKALHAAEDGITYNPKSEKGHFRKGLAHMGLNDPQSAVLDFEKVLEINEDNRAARTHLLTAKNKVRDMKEKDKAMLLKMMGGIAGIKELNQKPPGPGIQEQTNSRSPLRV
jgi:tetratricopeptide (TPR) repeat protein